MIGDLKVWNGSREVIVMRVWHRWYRWLTRKNSDARYKAVAELIAQRERDDRQAAINNAIREVNMVKPEVSYYEDVPEYCPYEGPKDDHT